MEQLLNSCPPRSRKLPPSIPATADIADKFRKSVEQLSAYSAELDNPCQPRHLQGRRHHNLLARMTIKGEFAPVAGTATHPNGRVADELKPVMLCLRCRIKEL